MSKTNRTMMLIASNMDQTDSVITLSADLSSFTFIVPGHMVNRKCRVKLINSMVANQDTATQTRCLLPNVFSLQIRANVGIQSFSTENNGSSQMLGSVFFPTGHKNASVNFGHETDLGICQLPSEMLVERLQYDDDGYVVPASSFNTDYKLVPLSVTFMIEFLE
mgnify:CR=1 FL=1